MMSVVAPDASPLLATPPVQIAFDAPTHTTAKVTITYFSTREDACFFHALFSRAAGNSYMAFQTRLTSLFAEDRSQAPQPRAEHPRASHQGWDRPRHQGRATSSGPARGDRACAGRRIDRPHHQGWRPLESRAPHERAGSGGARIGISMHFHHRPDRVRG